MSGKTDQAKGRAKEVIGTVTGNKDLESEGKADRQAGDAKQIIDHAKGKIETFVDEVEEKGEKTMKKIRDART